MLTLKKVKELVEAPSHAKRTPSPKMLFEEGIVLLRREFDQGSHLTVYNSGYVLFSAGKRNTVFHIHDCCGNYAYDAAEGKGDVIEEEYFENCEWHIRALFEGERKMEDNQAKCEGAGRSNVCVSYHALSEDWSEIADRTINMLEKIIENADGLRLFTSQSTLVFVGRIEADEVVVRLDFIVILILVVLRIKHFALHIKKFRLTVYALQKNISAEYPVPVCIQQGFLQNFVMLIFQIVECRAIVCTFTRDVF